MIHELNISRPSDDRLAISLDGEYANVDIGARDNGGNLYIKESRGKNSISFDGNNGKLLLGVDDSDGGGKHGNLKIFSNEGKVSVNLEGDNGRLLLGVYRPEGGRRHGDLIIRDKLGKDGIWLDGERQSMWLRDVRGKDTVVVSGQSGSIAAGIKRNDGGGMHGAIFIRNDAGDDSITLDGASGDISLLGADCAEVFNVTDGEDIEPGTVMVIENDNILRPSDRAYDKRVAGIVAGAGNLKPGIVLGKNNRSYNNLPIALMGKAYCKVDASYGSIETGDLLTTSPTSGYAMKASDSLKAFGAVIGKALSPYDTGKGLIPVLVSLQ